MSKIKLKVRDDDYLRKRRIIPFKDIRILLNSNRRYQNAYFYFIRETNFGRKFQLLERFSPSLVDLHFICGTESTTNSCELLFPKLEKLFINTDSEQQTIAVLQGATVLKEFDLRRSSSIPILMSVSSSLTTLDVGGCSKEMFGYILTAFPNLRKFHVEWFDFKEIAKLQNQSITDFSFGVIRLPNNIISSMKNLEFFNCWSCNENNLRMILTEGKRLKRVKINYWNRSENLTPTQIYESLMASDPTIPRDIEITNRD
jgi:hypothetical protein